jgi:hypothetical protein
MMKEKIIKKRSNRVEHYSKRDKDKIREMMTLPLMKMKMKGIKDLKP